MTKAVYAIFFFIFVITLTFSLSFKVFAQEKHATTTTTSTTFSYMEFFKHAIFTIKPATLTVTPSNKQVLGATTKPSETPTQKVTPTTTPTTGANIHLSSVSDYLLNEVNKYRASKGLPAVSSTAEVCAFATTRAGEIVKAFNHDGFNNRVANHTIPYAHWTRATENIAETTDYKEVVNLWIKSPEHAANMRDNTPYVCIAQNGNDYAYEGMRP